MTRTNPSNKRFLETSDLRSLVVSIFNPWTKQICLQRFPWIKTYSLGELGQWKRTPHCKFKVQSGYTDVVWTINTMFHKRNFKAQFFFAYSHSDGPVRRIFVNLSNLSSSTSSKPAAHNRIIYLAIHPMLNHSANIEHMKITFLTSCYFICKYVESYRRA